MPRRLLLCFLAAIVCSTSSGCGEARVVVVRPGQPIQLLENRVLKARRLKDDALVKQDVGGWVAMPQEHWDVISKHLETLP